MKRLFFISLFALIALVFVGCGSGSDSGGGNGGGGNGGEGGDPITEKCELSFYDGSGNKYDISRTVTCGDTITFDEVTLADHTFKGWRLDGTNSVFQATEKYTVRKNVDFIARWLRTNEDFVIFYDQNLDYLKEAAFTKGNDIFSSPQFPTEEPDWYKADATGALNSHILIGTINLYAIPNVHEITDEDGLKAVQSKLSHNYILLNDIKLTGATLDSVKGWSPIGANADANDRFSGIFNGNGYKVSGLFINISLSANDVYAGLFGYIDGGTVKNLGVEIGEAGIKATSYTYSYAGGIAGWVTDGAIISNCYSKGDITDSDYAGGIAGKLVSSRISNSYSTGNISSDSSSYSYAGGIAGDVSNTARISNSYSTGNISSYSASSSDTWSFAGGIAGRVSNSPTSAEDSTISNSYSTGDIAADSVSSNVLSYAGGIAGFVTNDNSLYSTISNSYSTGDIASSSYAGSIAGYLHGQFGGRIKIENCAAINANIAAVYVQRIVGFISSGTISSITNNFANKDMQLVGAAGGNGGVDRDLSLFQNQDTYKTGLHWEFGNDDTHPWKMPPSGSKYKYPILYWQTQTP